MSSKFDDLSRCEREVAEDCFRRDAAEIKARLEARLDDDAQAEADARLELEAERVERAREWERCRVQVATLKGALKRALIQSQTTPALVRVPATSLIMVLDELERLEERGV